jgi:hypothetical protein
MFNEFLLEAGKGSHDLSSDTLKLGIIDDTVEPTAADTTPTWGDYSANEVATTGNYTSGGETLTSVTFTLASGIPTLSADDILIAMDALGFTDGSYGILYNSTASDKAIGFVELEDSSGNPASEQAAAVSIEWDDGVVLELPANVAA